MMLGTGLPLLLLMVNDFFLVRKKESSDYVRYISSKQEKQMNLAMETPDEKMAILKQNLFGLRVIAFALAFTSLLLVGISFVSISGKMLVLGIAGAILLSAIIPLRATRKIKLQLLTISTRKTTVAETILD